VASTLRATSVEAHRGALRVGTVEHVFAALGGLGVHHGVAVCVDGPEMPLLDGGSAAWCAAIDRLGTVATPPRLRVVREAVTEVGASRYEWAPGDRITVEVRVELDGLVEGPLEPEARWDGDAADFRTRIAPARTFALARDVDELLRAGLARHVDAASVVVLAPRVVHCAGRTFSPDEPARHKLLDLVGDLYLHGGPPIGRVRAVRPGHAANQRALSRAKDEGIVVSCPDGDWC
jgi:UDP-3-O-[3-hydroxymyristoyl] N-acetylglucosamine deacetylase